MMLLALGAVAFRPQDGGRGRHATSAAHSAMRRRATPAVICMEEVECDVVIVGGGPAGCTCALYTARSDIKTVLLDKNPAVGALAITSHIANYPGVDRAMSGQALLDQMREQAIQYGTDYRRAQVFLVECDGDRKRVYTPDATFITRALVLATGAMGRPPSYKGEDTYLGTPSLFNPPDPFPTRILALALTLTDRLTRPWRQLLRDVRRRLLSRQRGRCGRSQPGGYRGGRAPHQICVYGALDHADRPESGRRARAGSARCTKRQTLEQDAHAGDRGRQLGRYPDPAEAKKRGG